MSPRLPDNTLYSSSYPPPPPCGGGGGGGGLTEVHEFVMLPNTYQVVLYLRDVINGINNVILIVMTTIENFAKKIIRYYVQ